MSPSEASFSGASRINRRTGDHMLYYTIFVGDRAVSLGCLSGAVPQPDFDARKATADLKPLCLMVLNTLVLPGAYR